MILDVARHKFYDGFITLLLTTLTMIVFVAVGVGEGSATPMPYSPLMSLISSATFGIPFLQKATVIVLYAASVLSLSRSTIRTHIYPADTIAAMALCAVMTLPMIIGEHALREAFIALFASLALGNMFFCFGPRRSPHHLFGAMFAASLLATIEAPLIVVPIAMGTALILARKRLREALIVIVGMLLPLFACFYIAWLSGEGFAESILAWWRGATTSLDYHILDSMSIPRLCFLAYVFFLTAVASIMNYAQRDDSSHAARGAWRAMQLIFMFVACALVFMPAASDSLLTVAVILSSVMLPALFVCSDAIVSTIAYIALIILAFAASF
jgi:hypothetical protein